MDEPLHWQVDNHVIDVMVWADWCFRKWAHSFRRPKISASQRKHGKKGNCQTWWKSETLASQLLLFVIAFSLDVTPRFPTRHEKKAVALGDTRRRRRRHMQERILGIHWGRYKMSERASVAWMKRSQHTAANKPHQAQRKRAECLGSESSNITTISELHLWFDRLL